MEVLLSRRPPLCTDAIVENHPLCGFHSSPGLQAVGSVHYAGRVTRTVRAEPRVVSALTEFRARRARRILSTGYLRQLSALAASELLSGDRLSAPSQRVAALLLGEIATLDDDRLSAVGGHAIFTGLIEPLGDAFTADSLA